MSKWLTKICPMSSSLHSSKTPVRKLPHLSEATDLPVTFSAPGTKLGEAVTYTLNEYYKLVRYMKYAFPTPDNNIAENAIRSFVIGRKNWLFCDTPRGVTSATIYSLCETDKANGIEPQDYLYLLFEKLPLMDRDDPTALETILPWNIQKQSRWGDIGAYR